MHCNINAICYILFQKEDDADSKGCDNVLEETDLEVTASYCRLISMVT